MFTFKTYHPLNRKFNRANSLPDVTVDTNTKAPIKSSTTVLLSKPTANSLDHIQQLQARSHPLSQPCYPLPILYRSATPSIPQTHSPLSSQLFIVDPDYLDHLTLKRVLRAVDVDLCRI